MCCARCLIHRRQQFYFYFDLILSQFFAASGNIGDSVFLSVCLRVCARRNKEYVSCGTSDAESPHPAPGAHFASHLDAVNKFTM